MTHDENQFASRHITAVFETSQDVRVDDMSRHANTEDISDPKVEHEFRRSSRIDATEDGRDGGLLAAAVASELPVQIPGQSLTT